MCVSACSSFARLQAGPPMGEGVPLTAASRDVPIYAHLGQALGAILTDFWVSGFRVVSCTVSGLETPRRFTLSSHQRAMVRGGDGGSLSQADC